MLGEETEQQTKKSLGIAKSIHIDAPARVVWDQMLNVSTYAQMYKTCTGVTLLSQGAGHTKEVLQRVKPGVRYLEDRLINGRTFAFVTDVTHVKEDHDAGSYEFSLVTGLWKSLGSSTNVLQAIDEHSCTLTIVYALVPDSMYGRIYLRLFRKRITRDGFISITSDLEDIRDAVTRSLPRGGQHQVDIAHRERNEVPCG
mmetsp:Transcript_10512/g.28978  ORF Transcript_10512/g.28978 Transcript_10512/m.28978 type:complete len:199 (-) Transcript_10512:300-896(-)|eukprot:CAMPEP_0198110722 /NCGR_PEP_ID=MMETSP1442-20131203/2724_1 /TAXON_ID= /ORGANISM="Craspedostauros australis, Strain CCMP3328" /LENGTH=198 /DNA_ID=CAMNT_0043766895 /DNA_START=394 /DNA_END=990 /DNA_ORIENTATION=+